MMTKPYVIYRSFITGCRELQRHQSEYFAVNVLIWDLEAVERAHLWYLYLGEHIKGDNSGSCRLRTVSAARYTPENVTYRQEWYISSLTMHFCRSWWIWDTASRSSEKRKSSAAQKLFSISLYNSYQNMAFQCYDVPKTHRTRWETSPTIRHDRQGTTYPAICVFLQQGLIHLVAAYFLRSQVLNRIQIHLIYQFIGLILLLDKPQRVYINSRSIKWSDLLIRCNGTTL